MRQEADKVVSSATPVISAWTGIADLANAAPWEPVQPVVLTFSSEVFGLLVEPITMSTAGAIHFGNPRTSV